MAGQFRIWMLLGSLFGAVGVTLGAYHAHGLEQLLSEREASVEEVAERMDNCEVAVRYQMIHAVALVVLGLFARQAAGRLLQVAGVLFTAGIVMFSGGLYLIVFAGNSLHPLIVPGGGLCLIVAWLALAAAACVARSD